LLQNARSSRPSHDDSRPLRALAEKATAAQAAALEFGELIGETLKDQGESCAQGRAAHAHGFKPASALARHIGQARL